jgi:hypothetical protein
MVSSVGFSTPIKYDDQLLFEEIDDQTVFVRPKLLLEGVKLAEEGLELNFAEITVNGRTEIIPIKRPYQKGTYNQPNEYTRYSGSPYEVLLKMAQDPARRESPVKRALQHESNRLLKKEVFLTYLLTPNGQKTLPICTLSAKSLLEVLELAQENRVDIDLGVAKTLFSKWTGLGHVQLAEALLKVDPSLIQKPEGQKISFYANALLRGQMEEALFLLQTMHSERIELTAADQWMQKASMNDCNFTNEEFTQLPTELQRQVYQIANIYVHKELLERLRTLGLYENPAPPEEAALFSVNMDAIDVEKTLRGFLIGLRKEGLLLTRDEFSEKNPSLYYHKFNNIGRILGRNYIEETAKRLKLSRIKVPKKTAVIQPKNPTSPSIAFTISQSGGMGLYSSDLQIYAEKIVPIDRKATREEMIGLLNLIEAIGYDDFLGNNNLFMGKNQAGEEGIYFIDTEYKDFSSLPQFEGIESLRDLMRKEDHPWLQEQLSLLRSKCGEKDKAQKESWALQVPVLIEHGFADRRKPFTFAIEDLTQETQAAKRQRVTE